MTVIKLQTTIDAPIEVCFDLSRNIDLHQLSTERTSERAIAGKTSGLIKEGDFVTWGPYILESNSGLPLKLLK